MILRARLRGIPVPPWGYLLAAGLLPAPLRAQYGLRWSAAQRALWSLFTHATHVVMCRGSAPDPVLGPLSRGRGALPHSS